MVIFTPFRLLRIAGILTVYLTLSWCHPIPYYQRFQRSGSYEKMTMLRKSCVDSLGNIGICMFKWDCISQKGITLSTCVNGFLFGACCSISEDVKRMQTRYDFHEDTDYTEVSNMTFLQSTTLSDYSSPKVNLTTPQENQYDALRTQKKSNSYLTSVESLEEIVNEITPTPNIFVINDQEKVFQSSNTSLHKSEISIYSLPNISESEEMVQIQVEKFESTLDDNNELMFSPMYNYTEHYNNNQNGKSASTESDDDLQTVQLLSERNETNFKNESYEYNNISFTKQQTDNNDESNLNYELISENQFVSTNLFPSNFTADKYSFTNESYTSLYLSNQDHSITNNSDKKLVKTAFKSRNETKQFIVNERNTTELNGYKIHNPVIKNTTIGIPIWGDYASLLPSSFQALISQLTSREAGEDSYILPSLVSNLTSNMKNVNHDLRITKTQNIISNLLLDQQSDFQNNTSIVSNFENNETVETMLNSMQTYSTLTVTDDENSNASTISYNEIYKKITDWKNDNSTIPINEGNITVNVTQPELDLINTKHYLESLNSIQKGFQVSCDKMNNIIKNCTKVLPDLETTDKLSDASEHSTSKSNMSSSHSIQYISTSTSYKIVQDTTYEDDKLINVSSSSEMPYSESDGINQHKNAQSEVDDWNTTDHTEEGNFTRDMTSIQNASIEGNFSVGLTTKAFTNMEVINDFFATYEQYKYPTRKTLEKTSIISQNILDTIDTTSQASTQKFPFTESIALLEKTLNALTVKGSETTGSYQDGYTFIVNPISSLTQNVEQELTQGSDAMYVESTQLLEVSTENNILIQNNVNKIIEHDVLSTNIYPTDRDKLDLVNISTNEMYEQELNNSIEHGTTQNLLATLNNWEKFTSLDAILPSEESKTNFTVKVSMPSTLSDISSTQSHINDFNYTTTDTVENVSFNFTPSNNFESEIPTDANITNLKNYSTLGLDFENDKSSISSDETSIIGNKWNFKRDCGVRPIQAIGRIVGGRNTYFGKWPWQALVKEATWLGLFVKNKCGGVLITSKYVLTAAHCQPGFLASLLVVLGTHDLSNFKENRTPVIRNVKRMVVHRNYNPISFENDLALLELNMELEFLPHVVPICLPHRNEDFTGKMAFVTGWGKLTHGGDVPNILQEVQVPIVGNRECQRMFYEAGHQKAIQNNFVCAGYTNGGQDSCEGDSGGPLMVQRKDNRWVLVGTVSHGIGCADPNLPGVYMRMSAYKPWIDSIINK